MNKEKAIAQMENSVRNNATELKEACELYLIAKAIEDDIKARARAIETKVLSENVYLDDMEKINRLNAAAEHGGSSRCLTQTRITRPFDTYKMTDTDFQDYLEKCYNLYLIDGIAHPKGKGYIPEAPAEETRREAENYLLDVFEKITPDSICHEEYEQMRIHWKYREQLIELALNILSLDTMKEENL